MQSGIDFFETSYIYHLSDKGHGLVFKNSLQKKDSIIEDLPTKNEVINNGVPSCLESSKTLLLDLNDEIYKNDFNPIFEGCDCYTCRKHTRAYINHLLGTKELLSQVLLVIHNLHHYGIFFQTIRQAISEDRLEEFSKLIE